MKDWTSVRKIKEGLVTLDLYAFLTTEPNGVVAPIHQKAMPVLLTTKNEVATWLAAPWEEARALQRALPDDMLKIVQVADMQAPIDTQEALLFRRNGLPASRPLWCAAIRPSPRSRLSAAHQ